MVETKRRGFLATAFGGVAVGGLASKAKGQGGSGATTGLVTSPPVVMAPRGDGVEIAWSVSRLSLGWVELKTAEGTKYLAQDGWGFMPQGEKVLRARLDGLKPGTFYRYRVVTEAAEGSALRVESEWREFRTLDPGSSSSRFVVWNDTHDNGETLKALDAATPAADFLLWNGDANKNKWTSEELIVPTLLNPGGTDFTAKRPLAFSWGNHDVRGEYGFQVSDYIAMPEGRPYYAMRSGPLAAVVLNTGEDKADEHPSFKGRVAFDALRREQVVWFEREVLGRPEFRDAPYRVVFCHLPLRWVDDGRQRTFDIFSARSQVLWHEMLVKWGTQVVISGHIHRAGKIEANAEFPYAQITGGGPTLDQATWIDGEADSKCLRLKVNALTGETRIEMEFPPIVNLQPE